MLKRTELIREYRAGRDRQPTLEAGLRAKGHCITAVDVYEARAATSLSADARDALRAKKIDIALHYSRRSAQSFVGAVKAAGLEISALALPQCCISDVVAAVLREAGASRVLAAAAPDENAIFETLYRAIPVKRRAAKSGKG